MEISSDQSRSAAERAAGGAPQARPHAPRRPTVQTTRGNRAGAARPGPASAHAAPSAPPLPRASSLQTAAPQAPPESKPASGPGSVLLTAPHRPLSPLGSARPASRSLRAHRLQPPCLPPAPRLAPGPPGLPARARCLPGLPSLFRPSRPLSPPSPSSLPTLSAHPPAGRRLGGRPGRAGLTGGGARRARGLPAPFSPPHRAARTRAQPAPAAAVGSSRVPAAAVSG